ncbi:PhzF family phenazine biosynthesis protein [Burkholderia pyrrocinia]|uniref:PhzF family phenazine biosynthesis protein n=1 Tax=Burkholderia pyrrocinia TaxID=60550 RepID=UPI00158A9895
MVRHFRCRLRRSRVPVLVLGPVTGPHSIGHGESKETPIFPHASSISVASAARMFAPRFGISEESATGTAAGPLACFLHEHRHIKDREIFIEQGRLMQPPSPSAIKVILDIDDGKVSRLKAGGGAKVVRSMNLEV